MSKDTKCVACGQFSGRGHRCPPPTIPAVTPGVVIVGKPGGGVSYVEGRVARGTAAATNMSRMPMRRVDETTVVVPPGKYWLGDPCYAVKDQEWMGWLEAADYEGERLTLVASTPSGDSVLGFSTQYGDGGYSDEEGREYGVDAGLIGLVPVTHNPEYDGRYSHLVEFDTPTECCIDMDGTEFREGRHHILVFGNVRIETGDGDPTCDNCGETVDYEGSLCDDCEREMNNPECENCGQPEDECSCEPDEDD